MTGADLRKHQREGPPIRRALLAVAQAQAGGAAASIARAYALPGTLEGGVGSNPVRDATERGYLAEVGLLARGAGVWGRIVLSLPSC